MKKSAALLLLFFTYLGSALAQSFVTSLAYNNVSQTALMLELPYGQEITEGFLVSSLKKSGYDPELKGRLFWKQNRVNGFYTFKSIKLEGLDHSLDLYFKIEQKSKLLKDQSVIYLLVSKGNEQFATLESDEASFTLAKKLMNNFVTQSAAYKLEMDVKGQEEEVKNVEKKLARLKDSEATLLKKIHELQDELKRNQFNQESQ